MIKLICMNGLPADKEQRADAERLAAVAKEHGCDWTVEEAFHNWEEHSDDYAAGWLTMCVSNEGLWREWEGHKRRMEAMKNADPTPR